MVVRVGGLRRAWLLVGANRTPMEPETQALDWYVLPGPIAGSVTAADATASLAGETQSNASEVVSAVGDITGDGRDDVLINQASERASETRFLPTSGANAWTDAVLLTSDPYEGIDFVGVGDVTGDGQPDLALEYHPQGWLLFEGPVTGELESEDAFAAFSDGTAEVGRAGDLDGDGHADLLAAIGTDELRVYAGPIGAGLADAAAVATVTAERFYFNNLAPGADADGDGLDDVLISGNGAQHNAWLFFGPLTGTRTPESPDWSVEFERLDRDGDTVVFAPDADGDGRHGIVVPDVNWSLLEEEGGAVLLYEVP